MIYVDIAEMRRSRVISFLRREKNTNEDLFHKVEVVFRQLWLKQMGATGEEVVKFMPPGMHVNIVMAILDPLLDRMFYIRNSRSTGFVQAWASSLIPSWKLSGEELFVRGQFATRLFIVVTGDIELALKSKRESVRTASCNEANTVFSILNRGTLGEYEFYYGVRYSCCANVKSESAFIFEISLARFQELLSEYNMEEDFQTVANETADESYKTSTSYLVGALLSNLTSSKVNKMVLSTTVERVDPLVLLPGSVFVLTWNLMQFFCLVFICFSAPLYLAFSGSSACKINANIIVENYVTIFVLDLILYFMVYTDIFLRSQIFAVPLEGNLITNRKGIRNHYFQHGMAYDILAAIPVTIIVLFIYLSNKNDRAVGSVIISVARLLLYIRTFRLGAYFDSFIAFVERLVLHTHISIPILRIVKAVLLVLFFCHIIACIYCFIGLYEGCDMVGDHLTCSWVSRNVPVSSSSGFFAVYIRALMWSGYTVTTIGYGNVVVVTKFERVYSIIVMIIGTMLCDHGIAAVLGSIVAASDSRSSESMRLFLATQKFLEQHSQINSSDTSSQLKEVSELRNYFLYLAKTSNNCTDVEDFDLIPSSLKKSFLSQFAYRGLSSVFRLVYGEHHNTGVWSDSDIEGFVTNLLEYAELYVAIPGEVLICTTSRNTLTACSVEGPDIEFQDKSIGNDIFIVRRGIVEVKSTEGDIPTRHLPSGSIICNSRHFFGCNLKDIQQDMCFDRKSSEHIAINVEIVALEYLIIDAENKEKMFSKQLKCIFSDNNKILVTKILHVSKISTLGANRFRMEVISSSDKNVNTSHPIKFSVPNDCKNISCAVYAQYIPHQDILISVFNFDISNMSVSKSSFQTPSFRTNSNISEACLEVSVWSDDELAQSFQLRYTVTCLDYCHLIRIKYGNFKKVRRMFGDAFITIWRDKTIQSRLASSRNVPLSRRAFLLPSTKTYSSPTRPSSNASTEQIETLLKSLHGTFAKKAPHLDLVEEDDE